MTGNVDLGSDTWEVTENITLCLNGYLVKTNASSCLVYVYRQGSLTLTDCMEEGTLTNPGGQVIHLGKGTGSAVEKKGTLLLYNGEITGGRTNQNTMVDGDYVAGGAGVEVTSFAEFKMYGGLITGNSNTRTDEYSSAKGGGVYVSAIFWMYGGKITGNSAGNSKTGIDKSTGMGGGVYLGLGSGEQRGFHMHGGSITDNYVWGTAAYGGGVYNNFIQNLGNFYVSGDVVISGNGVGSIGNWSNVYLNTGTIIEVEGEGLGANAKIGVTTQSQPTETAAISVVSGGGNTCNGKFFNDENEDILPVVGNEVKLSCVDIDPLDAVRVSETEAEVRISSSSAGSCYYQVVQQGAALPVIDMTGTGIPCSTLQDTIFLDSLTGAEAKDIYICVKDALGNVSNVLKMEIPEYVPAPEPPAPEPPAPEPPAPEPPAPVENDTDDDDEDEDEEEPEVPAAPVYVTYVVQSGDSMSRIAYKNGVSLAQLVAWNPQVKNPARIYRGQVLIVGQVSELSQSAAGTESPAAGTPLAGEYDTVQRGDTLSGIAARNGVSMESLRALNPELFRQKYIFANQRVRIR